MRTELTTTKGEKMAQRIGAVKYMECSALRHEGTHDIFETILRGILEASPWLRQRHKEGRWKRKVSAMLLKN
jgi:GTPase SAR1 family protein